jgi:signal-transduction protein with cAMP-binding, CBS, and nucleotidyltransferase domain
MILNRISGLPVLDTSGKLAGVVTEGDLLRRAETATERRRPRWLEFFLGQGRLATEYIRTHGRKIRDVMTSDPQTIVEETPLDEIVALMERKRIKRLPVMRGDKMVGIVSRTQPATAVSAGALAARSMISALTRSFGHIRAAISVAVRRSTFASTRAAIMRVNVLPVGRSEARGWNFGASAFGDERNVANDIMDLYCS